MGKIRLQLTLSPTADTYLERAVNEAKRTGYRYATKSALIESLIFDTFEDPIRAINEELKTLAIKINLLQERKEKLESEN